MASTAIAVTDCETCEESDGNPAYDATLNPDGNITTQVTVNGASSGGDPTQGDVAPYAKCKWEFDLNFSLPIEECCGPCPQCVDHPQDVWMHDACCMNDSLQVALIPGDDVWVGYYTVVSDPQGVQNIKDVWADVYHPDGTFKYQLYLDVVGMDTAGNYDKTQALAEFAHVRDCHPTLLTLNAAWASGFATEEEALDDIEHELDQKSAYLYFGKAPLSYCQPGGCYLVSVRATDYGNHWSDYLNNTFYYIPTSALAIDFELINYGSVDVSFWNWPPADKNFVQGDGKPTGRNIGNTPLTIGIKQNDTGLGQTLYSTGLEWNVEYDARLGADGTEVSVGLGRGYMPFEQVFLPDSLGLCKKEKLDFGIHVIKAEPGTYQGWLELTAWIDWGGDWSTPSPGLYQNPEGEND
jgi:hypothetical protein